MSEASSLPWIEEEEGWAWSQGKCLDNPRIEGGRWAWGEGFSPHSNHTALAGDMLIILNLVIEKMLEAPKLHLGKKKAKNIPSGRQFQVSATKAFWCQGRSWCILDS